MRLVATGLCAAGDRSVVDRAEGLVTGWPLLPTTRSRRASRVVQSHTAAHRSRGRERGERPPPRGSEEVETVRCDSARSVFLDFYGKQIAFFPMRYCFANMRAEI